MKKLSFIISIAFIFCLVFYFIMLTVKSQVTKNKFKSDSCFTNTNDYYKSKGQKGRTYVYYTFYANNKEYNGYSYYYGYKDLRGKLRIRYICNEPSINKVEFAPN